MIAWYHQEHPASRANRFFPVWAIATSVRERTANLRGDGGSAQEACRTFGAHYSFPISSRPHGRAYSLSALWASAQNAGKILSKKQRIFGLVLVVRNPCPRGPHELRVAEPAGLRARTSS